MAGIAFRLQKLLSGESYTELVRAYLYSAVIAAGPFLTAIATLAGLRYASARSLGLGESDAFLGLVVYAFAFSMFATAPLTYVVTRFLADKYYLREVRRFSPAYLAALIPSLAVTALLCGAWLIVARPPPAVGAVWYILTLSLSGVWTAMVFLSAARSYLWIVAAFVAGGALSIAGGLYDAGAGMAGMLAWAAVGQAACWLILTARIFAEFGFNGRVESEYAGYFRRFPELALIGLVYYAGIWADKVVFWLVRPGPAALPGLYLSPDYDTPMFLAYTTVIPSMAFFLVQMETSFARRYHAYYDAVRHGSRLSEIRLRRTELGAEIAVQLRRFVVFQGTVTGAVILAIYPIAEAFRLNPAQLGTFRIGLLGAFLQIGFVMCVNLLFYFDLRRDVLAAVTIYFAVAVGGTLASIRSGLEAHGFGYAAAGFAGLLSAVLILTRRLADLDYLTFMRQPILSPKFKLETETRAK